MTPETLEKEKVHCLRCGLMISYGKAYSPHNAQDCDHYLLDRIYEMLKELIAKDKEGK